MKNTLKYLLIYLTCFTLNAVAQTGSTARTLPRDPLTPYLYSKPTHIVYLEPVDDSVLVKRFTYASRGGVNTIYGSIVSPKQGGVYPALIMFHGGGSSADGVIRLQRRFAARGYVVMSIDLPGICDPAKATLSTGAWRDRPKGRDSRLDIAESLDSSTLADAIPAALQGFNMLIAEKNVDKERVGITGFSWGGYMTTMVSGLLGNRIKASYSVFGCGFYDRGSLWTEQLEKMPGKIRDEWLTYFDAGRRAPNIQCPYFIEATVNDKYFWPGAVKATLDTIKTEKNLSWSPNLDHVRPKGAEEMQLLYFNYYLKSIGKPFGRVVIQDTKTNANGKDLLVTVKMPPGIVTDSVILYYAEKNAVRHTKKWSALPVTKVDDKSYTAHISNEVLALGIDYYIYVKDSRKVVVSTYMQM